MYKTHLQTVVISMPKKIPVHGLEFYPIPPAPVGSTPLRRVGADGSITVWYENGCAERQFANGLHKTWWVRPRISDAILSKPFGGMYQFYSDGAVTSRCYDGSWYWGPAVDGAVEDYYEEKTPEELYNEHAKDRYSFWS